MPDIPIHNETEYDLSTAMIDQIMRDALEYFGESIRAIRVQYGIERHAFNARTGEMRYAFSPGDFGLVDTMAFHEPYHSRDVPSIDDDTEEELEDTAYEDVDVESEEAAAATLEPLDEALEDTDDEEDSPFQGLHDEFDNLEEEDDDDKDFLYDDEDDEYD